MVSPGHRPLVHRSGTRHGHDRLGDVRQRAQRRRAGMATARRTGARAFAPEPRPGRRGSPPRPAPAVNLAGVRHEDVLRGQEIATPGYLVPSRTVTVRLHCLKDARRPIKHRLPVRFHVGTQEVMGTVSLLDCDAVEPGNWGLAQLFLEEPATTVWGQPFVVRTSSATQTLGGGQVLQPTAQGAPPPPRSTGTHRETVDGHCRGAGADGGVVRRLLRLYGRRPGARRQRRPGRGRGTDRHAPRGASWR